MPQIPFGGERLVQPSNPVAIASSDDAGLQGRATAQFGNAMFDLGNKLDTLAKVRKGEEDKVKLTLALSLARREAVREKSNQAAASAIDDDVTGFGAVDDFSGRFGKTAKEIESQLPEHLRPAYQAGIADIDADFAPQVLTQEVTKRDKVIQTATAAVTSVLGQTARLDPKMTEEMMTRGEIALRDNKDIPPALMDTRVREMRQEILMSAVDGMVDRGDYASAEIELQKPVYAGIFDEKERKAMVEHFREESYKAKGRELQDMTLAEKRAEKFRQQKEQNIMTQAGVAFTQAGNSDVQRGPIKAWLRQQVDAGHLSQEKYRSIIEEKVFGEVADDRYESQLMANVIRGRTQVVSAIDKVMKERGDSVSMARANDIINKLGIYQERQRTDPNFNRLIQDGEQLLNTVLQPDLMAALDPLTRRSREARVRLAEGEYHRSLLRNPNQNPMALADGILRRKLNFNTAFIAPMGFGGTSNEVDEMTPQAIAEKRKGMAARMQEEMKKGTWSKKQTEEFMRQDMRLKAKGAAMQQDAAAKGVDLNDNAATTKGRK